MATLDLVNCQSVQVQVVDKVPTISIDKTDGAQVRTHRRPVGLVALATFLPIFPCFLSPFPPPPFFFAVFSIFHNHLCMSKVYLSATSLDTQIVSAKSSEMNVLVPGADGEFVESPLPEQYKSTFVDGKWVTEQTDIAG